MNVWTPRQGNQTQVFNADADIIGFGGQAFSNKTDTGFGVAYHKYKHTLMFSPDPDSVIRHRGNELFKDVAYRIEHKDALGWAFHHGGFLIADTLKSFVDYNQHTQCEWDAIIFDDAASMPFDKVMNAIDTLGASDKRVYMFFNPPTTKVGEWIIDLYDVWLNPKHLNPAEDGEVRYFARYYDSFIEFMSSNAEVDHHGDLLYPKSYAFYFSRMDENPDCNDKYKSILMSLPHPLNKKLLEGDFNVV